MKLDHDSAIGFILGALETITRVVFEQLNKAKKRRQIQGAVFDALSQWIQENRDKLDELKAKTSELEALILQSYDNASRSTSNKIYSRLADILEGVAKMLQAFEELAKHIKEVSENTGLMDELRVVGPEVHDFLKNVGDTYVGGTVDLGPVAMYIRLHKGRLKKAFGTRHISENAGNTQLERHRQVVEKAGKLRLQRITDRKTKKRLHEAYEKLMVQTKKFKLNSDYKDDMLEYLPEWLASVLRNVLHEIKTDEEDPRL